MNDDLVTEDEVQCTCPECKDVMQRTSEVIDVWFDSGSMPFAQYHYPLENKGDFESQFPADVINKWIFSRLYSTVKLITSYMDCYQFTQAKREIAALIDELSNGMYNDLEIVFGLLDFQKINELPIQYLYFL